jgi:hypothetical protein
MDTNREKAAAAVAHQDEIRSKVFLQWTEGRAKAGLAPKNSEQRRLLKELKIAKTAEQREEARRQAVLVAEAKQREARVAASLKKMKSELALIEAHDNKRRLEEIESALRKERPPGFGGYPLSPYERRVWLEAKARIHGD